MFVHMVLEGVADSALGVGLDVVGTAAELIGAGLTLLPPGTREMRQRVVSLDGLPVRSAAGRTVAVDGAFSLRGLRKGDVVVLPGMFAASGRTVAKLLAREDTQRAADLLAKAADKGVMLAASCSATFVLAASGLLEGRTATTTWWLAPQFARMFPRVSLSADLMVVDAGEILTAGSALAHADLMLALVARLAGPSVAHLVTRYLVLDERPSQARYMVMEHLRVSDPGLRAVERFIAQNIGRQLSLDELARVAAVSPRTLARRVHAGLGVTPHELVQRIRVSRAAHLLETTHASVDEIAAQVGYADAAAFRRVFRRFAGESPRRRRGPAA
ncbi:transcriptional regulator, AraC family [Cystobacter fuscus DSM 2262]|uniref:Transcriptional regulator, AraC family n=1 Tax=Cystobacter fuscus (strain ATCC 25194 / DSM 2262 / NBRC 100088 / M29) TaxID=1242864 RepID=S9PFJ2_CYSF2|nr:helix-turn-helix domain-containing protein [Cystobacter fuscus]EPX61851.1 transcriptional regulator, AraC family [Cystobacter fuscus DSM 2262]